LEAVQLLNDLADALSEQDALDRVVREFQYLDPVSAFYCSGSPVAGARGLQDKVECGRMVGQLVNDQVLGEILATPRLQAADKFPEYCKNNIYPLVWECAPTRMDDPDERDFFGLAADFGVTGGITVPIHQFDRSSYGNLTLFFDRSPQRWREALLASNNDIHVTTLYLHSCLSAAQRETARPPALSSRELDCIGLLARGYQTAQIADRLVLSEATVHEYVRNVRRKLNARTRSEAVALAVKFGMISL
jgi:DNA-binding CsgD family transcriptional regulator